MATVDDLTLSATAEHIMAFVLGNFEDATKRFDSKTAMALRSVNRAFLQSFDEMNGWFRYTERLQGIVDSLDETRRSTMLLGGVFMIDYKRIQKLEQMSRTYKEKITAIREAKLSVKPLAAEGHNKEGEGKTGTKRPHNKI